LAAVLVFLVALAAVAPALSALVALVWSGIARVVDRAVTTMTLKRHERGARQSDVPLALLASPLHAVVAAVSAAAAAIPSLLIGSAMAFTAALLQQLASGRPSDPTGPFPLAAAALVGVLFSWWGAGGTSLRRGSRSMVRGLTPNQVGEVAVTAVLLAAAAYLALRTQASGAKPTWWPLARDPFAWLTSWL
jgi:hypothetical protein